MTPAGTSNELDVHNEWEENTHTHTPTQQAFSFRTRHLCRQGVALAGTRQLRSLGPVSVHAHYTKEVTTAERPEGANGNGDGDGDEARTGTRMEREGG